jgi:hypothetical protein
MSLVLHHHSAEALRASAGTHATNVRIENASAPPPGGSLSKLASAHPGPTTDSAEPSAFNPNVSDRDWACRQPELAKKQEKFQRKQERLKLVGHSVDIVDCSYQSLFRESMGMCQRKTVCSLFPTYPITGPAKERYHSALRTRSWTQRSVIRMLSSAWEKVKGVEFTITW